MHQAIDDEIKNYIKDDPDCVAADRRFGTGFEKFMEQLESEVGFLPRKYEPKAPQKQQISDEVHDGPDIQNRTKYMRSGGNPELALSCFYFFVLTRDAWVYASNIEAQAGIMAFDPEQPYLPAKAPKKLSVNQDIQTGFWEALKKREPELEITTFTFENGTSIKDDSSQIPMSGEHVVCQGARIFFRVETHPKRYLSTAE